MFFDTSCKAEPECKKPFSAPENLATLFKLPTADNYNEFCKFLSETEEKKEYVSPIDENLYQPKTTPIFQQKQAAVHKPIFVNRVPLNMEKPDDSYAFMILRAIESAEDGMMTLSEIYSWIMQHYPYFRTADCIWKNSIRHNLSLNAAFVKVPRSGQQKGKGGFWKISMDHVAVAKINQKKRITRSYSYIDPALFKNSHI
ncbi:hypothetical protein NUSPORA_02101 [Nucleospora cyclopteri]